MRVQSRHKPVAANSPSRKWESIGLLLLLAGVAAFYGSTMRPGDPWCDDCGQYLQHARNIHEGAPYSRVNFVFHEDGWNPGPRVYPPIFPLLLSPFDRTFDGNQRAAKLLILAFFLAALSVTHLLFRAKVGPYASLGIIAALGFNPYFWDLKDSLLSDIPFLFFCLLGIFLAEKALDADAANRRRAALSIFAGIVLYLACGTRTAGIALIPALVATSLIRERRITRATWIMASICGALAICEMAGLRTFQGYLEARALQSAHPGILKMVIDCCRYYTGALSVLVLGNGISRATRICVFLVLVAAAAIGAFVRPVAGVTMYSLFVLFYFPLLLYSMQARYLIPIVPAFLFWSVAGGLRLAGRWPRYVREGLAVCVVVLIASLYLSVYAKTNMKSLPSSTTAPDGAGMIEFFGSHATQTDVIEFSSPRSLSFYSEQRASAHAPGLSGTPLTSYLECTGVTYIVTSNWDSDRGIADFLAAHRDGVTRAFHNATFDIWKLNRSMEYGSQ